MSTKPITSSMKAPYLNSAFLIALIHQRYRVNLKPGWTPRHASTFSCTIEGGLPVTLTRAPERTVSAAPADSTELESPR